jgi:hypothetical protein
MAESFKNNTFPGVREKTIYSEKLRIGIKKETRERLELLSNRLKRTPSTIAATIIEACVSYFDFHNEIQLNPSELLSSSSSDRGITVQMELTLSPQTMKDFNRIKNKLRQPASAIGRSMIEKAVSFSDWWNVI